MIVTIDGPAGAGKSSIARKLAERLGFEFLDTGAMYRAVTLAAIENGVAWEETDRLESIAKQMVFKWSGESLCVNDVDVTEGIRSPLVTESIKHIADLPAVREVLSIKQREHSDGRDLVSDGRDQGTEVFPNAQYKFFLTASAQERAIRRQKQLSDAGKHIPLDEVLAAQNRRDAEDKSRPIGALRPAADAVFVSTDGMTPEQVLDHVQQIVEASIELRTSS